MSREAQSATIDAQEQLRYAREVVRLEGQALLQLAGRLDERPSTERILQPLHLSENDVRALVAFLESLTDEAIDPALLAPPAR